jgi:hypothetical protein
MSTERSVVPPGAAAHTSAGGDLRREAPAGSSGLARLAWLVTILVSTIPAIVFTELTGKVPGWVPAAQVGVLVGLLVAGVLRPGLRPLRGFALVMLALLVLLQGLPRIDLDWQPLQSLFGANAFDDRMQAEQIAKLALALLMIGVLLLLGYRRSDFFLVRGDSQAPLRPAPLLGFPRPEPWWRFGLQWGFYVAAALAVVGYLAVRPTLGELAAVVPMLPSILFYAALNSFNEEMTYRAPMLAALEPVIGSTQAVWQAAVLFGTAHYFGMGLPGAIMSVFMGWLLGKAMVETRGLFWAWWIHFLADIAIFTLLATTLTGSIP